MFKKILLVGLVLSGFAFSQMSEKCMGDIKAQLDQAKAYYNNGEYEQAESLWQSIIGDQPGTRDAFIAQKDLAFMYLSLERYREAGIAISTLITDFSNEPNFSYKLIRRFGSEYKKVERYEEAERLYRIAEELRPDDHTGSKANLQMAVVLYRLAVKNGDQAKYEEAKEIFMTVLEEEEPLSPRSLVARKHLAFIEIKLDNNTGAQATYDKLCTDFADDANLPQVMFNIAGKYSSKGKYEKAESIYQQIMSKYPNHPKATLSPLIIRKNQILSLIEQGDDAAVHAAIEQMESDFKSHPGLPTPLLYIAEKYYENAYKNRGNINNFSNCVAVYEKVINDYLGTKPKLMPHAYRCTADCYRELGKYQKAIKYYQKVVDDGPKYRYTWYAQFAIGRILEGLKADRAIGASEADPQIRTAYEQVVSKYSDCPMAEYAQRWLRKNINSN